MTTTSLILCAAGAFYLTDLLFRVVDLIERPRKRGDRHA